MRLFTGTVQGGAKSTLVILSILVGGLISTAYGFKPYTHQYFAKVALDDMKADCKVDIHYVDQGKLKVLGSYPVRSDFCTAIRDKKNDGYYFQGVCGPDCQPDMFTGQALAHTHSAAPIGSVKGETSNHGTDAWLTTVWNHGIEKQLPAALKSKVVPYTIGFLTHAAGDMFAHTYVNAYADGPFSLERGNIIRHMVLEGYIAKKTPKHTEFRKATIKGIEDWIFDTLVTETNKSGLLHPEHSTAAANLSMPHVFMKLRKVIDPIGKTGTLPFCSGGSRGRADIAKLEKEYEDARLELEAVLSGSGSRGGKAKLATWQVQNGEWVYKAGKAGSRGVFKDAWNKVKKGYKKAKKKGKKLVKNAVKAAKKAAEKAKRAAKKAKKKAERLAKKARDAVKRLAKKAKKAAKKAAQKAKQAAKKALDDAKKAAKKAKKKIKELARKTAEKAKELAEKAKNAIVRAAEKLAKKAACFALAAMGKKAVKAHVKSWQAHIDSGLRDWVKNPAQAINNQMMNTSPHEKTKTGPASACPNGKKTCGKLDKMKVAFNKWKDKHLCYMIGVPAVGCKIHSAIKKVKAKVSQALRDFIIVKVFLAISDLMGKITHWAMDKVCEKNLGKKCSEYISWVFSPEKNFNKFLAKKNTESGEKAGCLRDGEPDQHHAGAGRRRCINRSGMDRFLALDRGGFFQWKKNALAFNAVQISKMTMLSHDSLQAMAHDAVKKKCATAVGKKIPNCDGTLRKAFTLKPNDRNVMLGWINSIDAGRMWCMAHTHRFESLNAHQVYRENEVKDDGRRAVFARHDNILFSTFFKPHAGLQPKDCAGDRGLNTPNLGWLRGVLAKKIVLLPKVSRAAKAAPKPSKSSAKNKRQPASKRPTAKAKRSSRAERLRPSVKVKSRPQASRKFRNSVLRLRHSKKCLDVPSGKKRNGLGIVQYKCHRRANQRWTMDSLGRIVSMATGKCLQVASGRKVNGAKVIQNTCSRQRNQVWQLTRLGQIRSGANGACLDVPGASKANGVRLQTYKCHRGANQRFSTR